MYMDIVPRNLYRFLLVGLQLGLMLRRAQVMLIIISIPRFRLTHMPILDIHQPPKLSSSTRLAQPMQLLAAIPFPVSNALETPSKVS